MCTLVLALLLFQTGTASLHGVVSDPSASFVPNAAVTVLNSQGFTRTARSDAQGRYQFNGIPSGVYAVRVASEGFSPWEQTGYTLAPDKPQVLDVALALRTQSEQITVAEASAAALDTDPSNNADALVLTKTDFDALPDDPDDLTADLQALAGPAAGPNGGQFFIDGFTGGRLPPKQSIREIRINQNPFAAQFDRPGQGRVEIFTKPGSDEFHGDVLFQFSDASFNSRNPFVTSKPPYRRRQWEGEVGGPLNRKTSFFLDFERRDVNENALVNGIVLDSNLNPSPLALAVVTPLTGIESNLRIDRQLTANHTLTLRYGYARDTNDNSGVGGFSLPSRAFQQETNENTFQFVETGVLNTHTVNETKFRFRKQDTGQSGGTAEPVLSVLDAFSSGGSSVGQSFDHQNRYEVQNSTSYVKGLHTIRGGGLLRGVNLNNQAMQNYAGTFTFTSLSAYRLTLLGLRDQMTPVQIRAAGGGASQFSLAAGNPLASLNQFDYGLFLQDDWRVRTNLTLSGGFRYEGQTHVHGGYDLSPRLGLAWAPGAKKGAPSKNVIRAGFGIFYDRLSESLTLDALRQDGIRQQHFLIPNPDFYPMVPAPSTLTSAAQPQTIRETDSHWRAPSMLQMAIAYERQLPNHITVSANYIHSIGNHSLRSRNINAPLPVSGVLPYGGVNAIYLYETSGVFRQNQLITSVTARVNSRFSLNGSYVFGNAMSNSDGAGTFPASQYDLSHEYGRAGFDIRHRFQLNGSLSTRWGLRFSPFLTIASGRPYNITTGHDLNSDGLYTDRPAYALNGAGPGVVATPYGFLDPVPHAGESIVPRNLGDGPGLIAANLRVAKTIDLGEPKSGKGSGRQLVFSVNARNFINHPNFAPPDGNLSSPLFGQSTALVNGNGSSGNRRLDLQARLNF
jgi:hypothetical protein